jgi:hypothetical protein
VIDIDQIRPDPDNANIGNPRGHDLLRESIASNGAGRSVLLDRDRVAIAGNKTIAAAKAAGVRRVVVVHATGDDLIAVQRDNVEIESKTGREMAMADNGLGYFNLEIDTEIVRRQAETYGIEMEGVGFDAATLAAFQAAADLPDAPDGDAPAPDAGESAGDAPAGDSTRPDTRDPLSLAERFVAPPFDVFDSRQGYWQDRRRAWLAMGLRPETGREAVDVSGVGRAYGEGDIKTDTWLAAQTGLSVFDPVLAEICYRWFCPRGGRVLDPFAGGSVRGIVAHALGLEYIGVEPRPEQVRANQGQAETLCPDSSPTPSPVWMRGYSQDLLRAADLFGEADFVLTCPPFHDLERYSDDPRDLSAMPWADFERAIGDIVGLSLAILKENRFIVWVVGDIRDGDGRCRNLPGVVVNAHLRAGAALYQDAVFLTPLGSLPVRAGQAFLQSRKLGRCHQKALIFYKGQPRRIREYFPADLPIPTDADTSSASANGG